MGYDFTLYEITNHQEEDTKEYKVKEVLYLSNSRAMLVATWLDRNNVREDPNNFNKIYHYVEVDGGMLEDLTENLETVLNEKDKHKRDTLALFYFPCRFTVPTWISSTEMFSESYYADLEYILERVKKVLNEDPDRQLFVYNFAV